MSGYPIWFELMVPDPQTVAPFYRAVLGWEIPPEGMAMPTGTDYRMIVRADGGNAGGVLTIFDDMAAHGAKPAWIPYFHAEEIDALAAKAASLGATIHMGPMDIGPAGRVAMLSDPQGAAFYLIKPAPPPDMPDATSDVFDVAKAGHCRWLQLDTTDATAANAFYSALFDWNTQNTMPMGSVGDYRFIECEGTAIGAINPMIAEADTPHWLMFFGVSDIDAGQKAAVANGGSLAREIHQVPGGEYIFFGQDPAGAKVGFVGPQGERS